MQVADDVLEGRRLKESAESGVHTGISTSVTFLFILNDDPDPHVSLLTDYAGGYKVHIVTSSICLHKRGRSR